MDETGLPQLETGLLNNTQPYGVQGHATGGAISEKSPEDMIAEMIYGGHMPPHFQYAVGGSVDFPSAVEPTHMAEGKSTTLTGMNPQTLYGDHATRMHSYMPQDMMHARYAPKHPPAPPPSMLSKIGSFLLNHGLNAGVAGMGAYDAYNGMKESNPEKTTEGLGSVATSFMPLPIQAAWELATHHPEANAQQTRDTSYGPLQELMNKKQQNDANNADLWYQATHKYTPPTSMYALDPYHPSLDNTQ